VTPSGFVDRQPAAAAGIHCESVEHRQCDRVSRDNFVDRHGGIDLGDLLHMISLRGEGIALERFDRTPQCREQRWDLAVMEVTQGRI